MSLLLYSDPSGDGHPNPPGHPERPERVAACLAGIDRAGIADGLVWKTPRPATREELLAVHSASYLDALQRYCDEGGGMIDADTWAGPDSLRTARHAAGAGLAAIEAMEAGEGEVAFVAMRPPGHHALPRAAMGFCLLNNVAVAAAALAARGERVAVIDWDVHHGNGTQEIFWNDPAVLYVSTHQWPLYPGTGAASETGGPGAPGLTVNLPLPAGSGGELARRALDEIAAPVIDAFSPTWVLVSAGFDAHRDDPLASLALTAADFADLAGWVRAWAPEKGRTLLFLEGGYDLEALSKSVGACLAALCGGDYRPEATSCGGPGPDALDAIRAARRAVDERAVEAPDPRSEPST